MSSVSVEMMIQKFEILPDQAKKEALDFLEFLVQKSKPRNKKIDKKKILLGMSYWNEEDARRLDEVRQHMNQWKPETF
jgi:hypothetical protein